MYNSCIVHQFESVECFVLSLNIHETKAFLVQNFQIVQQNFINPSCKNSETALHHASSHVSLRVLGELCKSARHLYNELMAVFFRPSSCSYWRVLPPPGLTRRRFTRHVAASNYQYQQSHITKKLIRNAVQILTWIWSHPSFSGSCWRPGTPGTPTKKNGIFKQSWKGKSPSRQLPQRLLSPPWPSAVENHHRTSDHPRNFSYQ